MISYHESLLHSQDPPALRLQKRLIELSPIYGPFQGASLISVRIFSYLRSLP